MFLRPTVLRQAVRAAAAPRSAIAAATTCQFGRRCRAMSGKTATAGSDLCAPLDGVVVGCYEGETPSLEHFSATAFAVNSRTNNTLFEQHAVAGFTGKPRDSRVLYPVGGADAQPAEGGDGGAAGPPSPPRVAVVGLGKRPSTSAAGAAGSKAASAADDPERIDRARVAAAAGVRALRASGARRIGIERELGGATTGAAVDQALAEGAGLALYKFDHLKTRGRKGNGGAGSASAAAAKNSTASASESAPGWGTQAAAEKVQLLLVDRDGLPLTAPAAFETGLVYAQSQNLARHLMETPANLLTPRRFAETAVHEFADVRNTTVHVRDEAWCLSRGMHALHAVAKGSREPLQYLEIHYYGRTPGMADADDAPVDLVLVGKGVTFDSGGISIKPSAGMGMMKGDMGGAATVVSSAHGIARLKVPINLVVLVPLCENMPSGCATKPGDVVRAANGLTIEIDNTDAEGRLILADALYHATSFNPKAVVDVATLTGAMDVALGRHYTGVFSSSTPLWDCIAAAAARTGDHAWRMPLDDRYLQQMESHVADLKNAGDRAAGACTAAIFLKQFLVSADAPADVAAAAPPFAHLDMAGVMHYAGADNGYNVKGMSGRPTRMLMTLMQDMAERTGTA